MVFISGYDRLFPRGVRDSKLSVESDMRRGLFVIRRDRSK